MGFLHLRHHNFLSADPEGKKLQNGMLISIVVNATARVTSVHINISFTRLVNTNEISGSHRTYLRNSEVEKEFLLKKINGNKKKYFCHYLNATLIPGFGLERCLSRLMSHISDLWHVA